MRKQVQAVANGQYKHLKLDSYGMCGCTLWRLPCPNDSPYRQCAQAAAVGQIQSLQRRKVPCETARLQQRHERVDRAGIHDGGAAALSCGRPASSGTSGGAASPLAIAASKGRSAAMFLAACCAAAPPRHNTSTLAATSLASAGFVSRPNPCRSRRQSQCWNRWRLRRKNPVP